MSEELKAKDLATIEFSIDKVCTLYFYEDRVLRGIHSDYTTQVREMFDSGMMKELVEKQLFVKTWISDTKIEGYELVIEHERIPYWNYPYEWSFTMLHRAANLVLDANEVVNKYGYCLLYTSPSPRD